MKEETKKYIENIKSHIKLSMCLDGEVNFIQFCELGELIKDSDGNFVDLQGLIFECNDSKRGRFFIAWYTDQPEE